MVYGLGYQVYDNGNGNDNDSIKYQISGKKY